MAMPIFDSLIVTSNVAFFYAILIYLLSHTLKLSKQQPNHVSHFKHKPKPKLFSTITLIFFTTTLISLFNVTFLFFHYYTTHGTLSYTSLSISLTWLLATIVSFYSLKTTTSAGNNKFPLVLILWWFYSTILDIILLSLELVKNLDSINLWIFFSKDNIIHTVSLPMLLLLCFNALNNFRVREQSEKEQGLLDKKEETLYEQDQAEVFTKASLWSKLTFRWLNPIFKLGRILKLELSHVPFVPHSETAASASSMLEESIRKQKLEGQGGSLTKAIFHSIWKSLALNAVLAGVNTIASYIGPLLISNFVNFLLSNNSNNSSIRYGHILAFIFFLSKTVESLSQRQWYFGAQRMGIRVRAALMALVYSKSLMIKCAGPTHGKIINLINVDVDRVGDFCWYIHGVWLLPVQVILALIILYINLGGIPSIAALAVTILVMVFNTPLANRQETLHSRIMEAKDSRIKMILETMKNIRILKLHSWESTFMQKLLQLRDREKVAAEIPLHMLSSSHSILDISNFGFYFHFWGLYTGEDRTNSSYCPLSSRGISNFTRTNLQPA